MRPTLLLSALLGLGLGLAACTQNSGGEGGGGSTATGGSTGGATDTGGTTTSSSATSECEANVGLLPGDSCGDPIDCTYPNGGAPCQMVDPVAHCIDHVWHVDQALTCTAPDALKCDPTGTWKITTTGPYVDTSPPTATGMFDSYTSFDVQIFAKPSGLLWVQDYNGKVSGDGCTLTVWRIFENNCMEIDGQSFCDMISGTITLDLSQAPVTGSVEMRCDGECSGDSTAPVQAEKQP